MVSIFTPERGNKPPVFTIYILFYPNSEAVLTQTKVKPEKICRYEILTYYKPRAVLKFKAKLFIIFCNTLRTRS